MMDLYTKITLTVIAGALMVLIAQNGMKQAGAASYNDTCGAVGHPACQVTWSTPMAVYVVAQQPPQPPRER